MRPRRKDRRWLVFRSGLWPRSGRETVAVDSVLIAWRHKAADILLVVVAVSYLPMVVLLTLGYGPPLGRLAKGIGISLYLVVAAAALFRSVEFRMRLLAAFFAAYASLVLTSIVFPLGPFAQAVAVTMPIFVLVLLGPREARVAIVASAMVILLAPLLLLHPRIAQLLAMGPAQVAMPRGVVWMHVLVQMTILSTLMVLLD